jgi:CRISPR-associated endoribonuclease Cas6
MYDFHLDVRHLRACYRVQKPFYLSPYHGSTLRGTFGHALKAVSCCSPYDECECTSCPDAAACAYCSLFETPPWDGMQFQTDNLPHPFVVRFQPGEKHLDEGDQYSFDLLLFGRGVLFLDGVSEALARMAGFLWSRDRGRVAFESIEIMPPEFSENVFPNRLVIQTVTPLMVVHRGKVMQEVPFELLMRKLIRRLSLMIGYTEGIVPDWGFRAIFERARQVTTRRSDLTRVTWRRDAQSHGHSVPMVGMVGEIEYAGSLEPFSMFLQWGELVHVGKNASMGFGQFSL